MSATSTTGRAALVAASVGSRVPRDRDGRARRPAEPPQGDLSHAEAQRGGERREWPEKKLYGCFTESTARNSALSFTRAMQFNYGRIVDKNESFETTAVKDIYAKYSLVKKGDIVINGLNLNYDVVSQRVAIVPKDGIITSAYIVLRPREGILPEFFCYLFKSMDSRKIFHGMGTGIRLTLSFKELKNMPLPLPPLLEQEAIVAYLDAETRRIDKAIAAEEKMIALLQERREIVINEAVGGGQNFHAEAQRGGEWEVKRFKNLFSTCTGISFTKAELVEEGCPVLSYGQIHSKDNPRVGVNRKLIRHIPAALTTEKSLAYKGDFLFADTSEDLEGCGNCICVDTDEPIYAGSHVILARKQHKQIGRFLAYEFASVSWRKQLRKLVNGVKVYSVTQTILNSVPVWLPSLAEQEAIVARLDEETGKIGRAIAVKRRQIELLRERRQIVIDEVVTGKVKVA